MSAAPLPANNGTMLFRRIFNFEKAKVDQLEKRLNQRYAPGPGFPLKAILFNSGRESPAKVQDISSNGLRLLLAHRNDLQAGHHVRVDLLLAQHRLALEARIAHLQSADAQITLGLGLLFPDPEPQRTYYQLMQPVVIGQTLKVMAPEQIIQDTLGFTKRVYVGESDSMLTMWHEERAGFPPHHFEFRMADYYCRGKLELNRPGTYALESQGDTDPGASRPVFDTSGGLHDEICQLYRWVLPNLSPAVPAETRTFLKFFAG